MASRLARVALLRTRVKPSSTYNVSSTSRRFLHVTSGMMDGPTVLPDEFMEQARKEGAEKEKERKEADREEEIKLELLDASLKQVSSLWPCSLSIVRVFPAVIQVMRYGWSKEAVRAAAEELGRPSVVAGLVKVPINMQRLLSYFYKAGHYHIYVGTSPALFVFLFRTLPAMD